MKKLTILILASLFCFGLFAAPKIPKINNYFSALKDDYSGSNYYCYVNNSCTNIYKIFAEVNGNHYTLYFKNLSLQTDIEIALLLNFSSETALDNYINNIDTTNLETEFLVLRNKFIKQNIAPIYKTDENNKIVTVMYMAQLG